MAQDEDVTLRRLSQRYQLSFSPSQSLQFTHPLPSQPQYPAVSRSRRLALRGREGRKRAESGGVELTGSMIVVEQCQRSDDIHALTNIHAQMTACCNYRAHLGGDCARPAAARSRLALGPSKDQTSRAISDRHAIRSIGKAEVKPRRRVDDLKVMPAPCWPLLQIYGAVNKSPKFMDRASSNCGTS
eukprot:3374211-Pleurochrysis_carterae.AAC.1